MNVLVIGKGPWGRNIARDLRELGHNVVHAGRDFAQYLGGVHAACVATPLSTHVLVATECLRAGLPTYIEKPGVESLGDLTRLQDAWTDVSAERWVARAVRDVPVFFGHTYCYGEAVQSVKSMMRRYGDMPVEVHGSLGREYTERADCSTLWDWGVHLVSVFLYLVGPRGNFSVVKGPRTAGLQSFRITTDPVGASARFTVKTEGTAVNFLSVIGAHARYQANANSVTVLRHDGSKLNEDIRPLKHIYGTSDPDLPLKRALREFILACAIFHNPSEGYWVVTNPEQPSSFEFTHRVTELMLQLGPAAPGPAFDPSVV